MGLKLKEIKKKREFKQNRQDIILKDLDSFIQTTLNKARPVVPKKEKDNKVLTKLMKLYYVGFDSDESEVQ